VRSGRRSWSCFRGCPPLGSCCCNGGGLCSWSSARFSDSCRRSGGCIWRSRGLSSPRSLRWRRSAFATSGCPILSGGWPTGRVRSDTGRNNKNLIVCYRGSAGLALMMMTTMWMIRKPIMAQLYVASDGLQVAVLAGTSHTQNDDTYI